VSWPTRLLPYRSAAFMLCVDYHMRAGVIYARVEEFEKPDLSSLEDKHEEVARLT
jgi:hypothetical protein